MNIIHIHLMEQQLIHQQEQKALQFLQQKTLQKLILRHYIQQVSGE